MKCLGLVGDLNSEATVLYLRRFDDEVSGRFGAAQLPRLIFHRSSGVSFATAMQGKDWAHVNRLAMLAAKQCVAAGAEAVLLGSSTLHVARDAVAGAVGVPVLDMVDAAVEVIARTGIRQVGLLGTRFGNEQRMWQDRCADRGLLAVVPIPESIDRVSKIIRDELSQGQVRIDSKKELLRVCADFRRAGSRVIVVAAPELNLILRESESALPLLDAMAAQVAGAVTWATSLTVPDLPTEAGTSAL